MGFLKSENSASYIAIPKDNQTLSLHFPMGWREEVKFVSVGHFIHSIVGYSCGRPAASQVWGAPTGTGNGAGKLLQVPVVATLLGEACAPPHIAYGYI